MRIQEIRAKSTPELQKELEEAYRELMNLRFRWATHQLDSHEEINKVRAKIARIKTVLRERELGISR